MRRWVILAFLATLWPLAWLLLWQIYLFDVLEASSNPGVTVLTHGGRRSLELWFVTGFGIVFVLASVLLLFAGSSMRTEAARCAVAFRIAGASLLLATLPLPVLFPRVESIILDEPGKAIATQTRWLYWEESNAIAFADIDRIQHMRVRWLVEGGACLSLVTLKVIANDRTVIAMPDGLRTDSMARTIADAADASDRQIENITDYGC